MLEVDQDHIHCEVVSEPRISPLASAAEIETGIDHSARAMT
jgi:hypothetical protein